MCLGIRVARRGGRPCGGENGSPPTLMGIGWGSVSRHGRRRHFALEMPSGCTIPKMKYGNVLARVGRLSTRSRRVGATRNELTRRVNPRQAPVSGRALSREKGLSASAALGALDLHVPATVLVPQLVERQ